MYTSVKYANILQFCKSATLMKKKKKILHRQQGPYRELIPTVAL